MSDTGHRPRLAALAVVVLLIPVVLHAQAPGDQPSGSVFMTTHPPSLELILPPPDPQRRDTVRADTVRADTIKPDTARRDTLNPDSAQVGLTGADTASVVRRSKSSWTAVGLSAVLPGAGQVYTENYWKVPVILGLGGYWVYEWGRNNKKYKEYRDLYNESIETNPPNGDQTYLDLREAYKDQRDAFAWYLGILYLVQIVDAYVGAELYDFDVGPELGAGGAGARATFRLHL